MNLTQNPINYTLEEAKEKTTLLFKHRDILLDRAEIYHPQFGAVVNKMISCVCALAEDAEEIQSLGDVELKMLYGGLSFIPIVLLNNRHPDAEDACAALILMTHNYLNCFPDAELEELVAALYNLIALENNFSLLLLASDVMLMQFKSTLGKTQDYYSLSRNFVAEILEGGKKND